VLATTIAAIAPAAPSLPPAHPAIAVASSSVAGAPQAPGAVGSAAAGLAANPHVPPAAAGARLRANARMTIGRTLGSTASAVLPVWFERALASTRTPFVRPAASSAGVPLAMTRPPVAGRSVMPAASPRAVSVARTELVASAGMLELRRGGAILARVPAFAPPPRDPLRWAALALLGVVLPVPLACTLLAGRVGRRPAKRPAPRASERVGTVGNDPIRAMLARIPVY